MKHLLLALFALTFGFLSHGQNAMNIGIGYHHESPSGHGVRVEFEHEWYAVERLSLPLRTSVGFFSHEDYNAVFLSEHIAFRQRIGKALLLEQGVGLGLIAKFFDVEGIFYQDKYGSIIRYYDGANIGIMPSVNAAFSYNLSADPSSKRMLWVRPEAYWDLNIRGLHLPYFSLQIGYTHQIR